jgi:hypothetical protein
MSEHDEPVLVRYYAGEIPDHLNRYLAQVQGWPNDLLEWDHDFIQWMFPLREPSAFNPFLLYWTTIPSSHFTRGRSSERR